MQNIHHPYRLVNAVISVTWFALCPACVSSHRAEPAGSVATTSPPANQPSPSYAEPPPATKDEATEDLKKQSPVQSAPAGGAEVQGARPAYSQPASAAPAAPAHARRAAPKSDLAEKKASAESAPTLSSPDDLRAGPLLPTLADSTEIRSALQDFQGAADMLAASHGCDEGCRAFQSMQRAAARICNLVSNRDPTQRCAAARGRVSEAEHSLRDHCGNCSS
jgi:hypothetical protein